jgi:hypothetical protein
MTINILVQVKRVVDAFGNRVRMTRAPRSSASR